MFIKTASIDNRIFYAYNNIFNPAYQVEAFLNQVGQKEEEKVTVFFKQKRYK